MVWVVIRCFYVFNFVEPASSESCKFIYGWCLFVLVEVTAFVASPVARGQSAFNCDEGRPFTASKAERYAN
jgi:hypothetical protein